ncbi:MAG: hypothetical protein ACKV0T_00680 [Planctomycetales bacterium]
MPRNPRGIPSNSATRPNARRRRRGSHTARAGTLRRAAPHNVSPRQASVLVVVLVVVALLALGAYTFSEFMIVEAQATSMYAKEAQARAAADSGVELAASLLTERYQQSPVAFYSSPEMFQGVLVHNSDFAKGRCRFSVVSAVEGDPSGRLIRFGLTDESSRMNLNALTRLITDKTQQRTALRYLPDMTDELADAILDFIDTDSTPREYGAEDETYAGLGYNARNGALDSLDELLQVRGVTPWLLFGEDANRNGLLDPNENDGALTEPLDNADGLLNRGWSAYLTLYSRESNLQPDGTPKINVNMNALGDLYDQIEPILGAEAATFVMAYRLKGPVTQDTGSGQSGGGQSMASSGGGSGTGNTSGASRSATGGGSSAGSSGGSRTGSSGGGISGTSGVSQASSNLQGTSGTQGVSGASTLNSQVGTAQSASSATSQMGRTSSTGSTSQAGGTSMTQLAQTASQAMTLAGGGTVTRAGIDVTAGGSVQINSLYELLDAKVSVQYAGSSTTTELDSPWTSEQGNVRTQLPKLFEALSTTADKFIDGRVNINQARAEVLMGIPNMTQSLAESIVAAQAASGDSDPNSERSTTGWLLVHSLVDLPTIQQLDKFLTARGDIYRLQSVGYFDQGGPSARIESVIDATQDPPAVVFQRDLTDLGRGFSPQLLTTGGN